jgi:hypothetical protein
MRFKQKIGRDHGLDLAGCESGKPWLRMPADIGKGPAVEAALLDADQIIGRQFVA